MIERVVVVIPARDEQDLVGRCLESVLVAAGRVSVPVDIVVVADGCLDGTAEVARSCGVEVLEIASSNVGTARRVGTDRALAAGRLGSTWIANTDADSVVPPNWISCQLDYAAAGADLVIGTVRPEGMTDDQLAVWRETHIPGQPNGHVHGANLGMRAAAYLRAGGYRDLPEHEDTDLVDRVRSGGGLVVASDDCEVLTSGRRVGRTPGGYARYLRELDRAALATG